MCRTRRRVASVLYTENPRRGHGLTGKRNTRRRWRCFVHPDSSQKPNLKQKYRVWFLFFPTQTRVRSGRFRCSAVRKQPKVGPSRSVERFNTVMVSRGVSSLLRRLMDMYILSRTLFGHSDDRFSLYGFFFTAVESAREEPWDYSRHFSFRKKASENYKIEN